jgi:hypothetical protein
MNEPVIIGSSTWKALNIKGGGCIVQGEKGILHLPFVTFQDGELVSDDEEIPASRYLAAAPQVAPKGPTSQAEIQVKGFLDQMKTANLSGAGEYGGNGPYLNKLRELLLGIELDSPMALSLGRFLELGDHPRYHFAAAVIGLDEKKRDEFSQMLASPQPDVVEAFVEKCITGAA